MSYHVIVQFDVPPEKRDDFAAHAHRDAAQSLQNEPGTLAFSVLQDEHDPNRFVFDEVYENEAAFDHHATQPAFTTFINAVQSYLISRTVLAKAYLSTPDLRQ